MRIWLVAVLLLALTWSAVESRKKLKWNSKQEDLDQEPEPAAAAPEPVPEPEAAEETTPEAPDEQPEAADDSTPEPEEENGDSDSDRPYEVNEMLGLHDDNHEQRRRKELLTDIALKRLYQIVENQITPVEKPYKYEQLSMDTFGEAEIFAKPLIVIMEPYKHGRSSLLPVLLGETQEEGEEPANNDFVIYSYGAKPRTLEGIQVLRNETFESLQRFGKSLVSHLKAVEMPHRLLERVTIVETPDVVENSKFDKEYPIDKVHQWFVSRADAVILVVEPERADVGPVLEAVFRELKDQEDLLFVLVESSFRSTIDDSVRALRKLAWSYAPHFDVNDAPKMYLTSFERPLEGEGAELFGRQEKQFLHDLNRILDQRFKNRLTTVFERAVDVRSHALLVDKYVDTFTQKKSFFGTNKVLEHDIINFPAKFFIYDAVLRKSNASADDLAPPEDYKAFFGVNHLSSFKTLVASCSFFKGCPADRLQFAIQYDLPELLEKFNERLPLCLQDAAECVLEEKKFVPKKKEKKGH